MKNELKNIKIKGKIFKTGDSYAIRIRKALIEAEILREGEEVELNLPLENAEIEIQSRDLIFSEIICDEYPTLTA